MKAFLVSCAGTVVLADNLCVATGGWPDRKLICIRSGQIARVWTK